MRTAEKIIKILNSKYKINFEKENPFRVLIGVLLSHRTRDTVSVPAAERLFSMANTPEKILELPTRKIEKIIYPVGFYRQKANRVKGISKMLLEKFSGKVPKTKEELMQFPGIGPKSASIVLAYGFGIPAIAVDTHVNRVSQRLGWVPKKTPPEKTQPIIEKLIPKKYHLLANHLLVEFGRDICRPIAPHCFQCPVYDYCRYERKKFYKNLQKKQVDIILNNKIQI